MGTLYDEDLYSWAMQQADALRAAARLKLNAPLALDWANLAEEIEDLGNSQARELSTRYYRLLTHLLKWQFQPDQRSFSWRGTITEQRKGLRDVIKKNPGLKPQQAHAFAEAYPDARELASDETGLPQAAFPEACPYSLDQAADPAFWPGPPWNPPLPSWPAGARRAGTRGSRQAP